MKITKKLENLFFKGIDVRELNCREGFRLVSIRFENKEDFRDESEGEEYIICLEKFLNDDCNLDYFVFDGSRSVISNVAEVCLCVLEEDIKHFNSLYRIFKQRCNEIIEDYRYYKLNKELDEALTELEVLQALENENYGFTESEIKKLEQEYGFMDEAECNEIMNGLQDELESCNCDNWRGVKNIYKELKHNDKINLVSRILDIECLKKYTENFSKLDLFVDIMTAYNGLISTYDFKIYELRLNLYYLDTTSKIIKTIAHEIAHMFYFDHSKNHKKITSLIKKLIKIELNII